MLFDILKSLTRRRTRPASRSEASIPASGRSFIAFITQVEEPHFLAPGEKLEADQASMRLRVGAPARELARRSAVCLIPVDYVQQDPDLTRLGTVRAVAVGKLPVRFFTQQRERALAFVEWIEHAAGRFRIVIDFSDDLRAASAMYSQPALVEFQKRLLAACPATVPTGALRERLAADARHGISVIEDPFESPSPGHPRFAPGPVLQLAWFGVFAPEFRPFVESHLMLIARKLHPRPIELAFVTHATQAALVHDMAAALRHVNPHFLLRHVAWSVEATARALERADLVVLPQDARSDWGYVKSHNRLVETIRAGRLAVASPIPAYKELAEYAWVGDDLAAGIEWALGNPAEVLLRVGAGQAHVAERFAPERIAAEWARALGV